MIKILFAAAELTPLAKSGGLADVVGALPIALRQRDFDVRCIIPKYEVINAAGLGFRRGRTLSVTVGGGTYAVPVWEGVVPKTEVPAYLLENPDFLSRGGIYFEQSADERTFAEFRRFLFFQVAVAAFLQSADWQPDLLHGHDWETALLPLLTHRRTPFILTLHNVAMQGIWNAGEIRRFLRLDLQPPPELVTASPHDNLNLLGIGIRAADRVTTVSPNYAREILAPEFGLGLESMLREAGDRLVGILNGIDTERFDPAHDPDIVAYSAERLEKKQENTRRLRADFGLTGAGPIFGHIGRLTEQKGIDLIASARDWFARTRANLVILGKGLTEFETIARALPKQLPGLCATVIGFDPVLAQRIYAGSDFFLMPSRFEPCGLGQLISLRYGTPPIVRSTGGLKDTVRDVRQASGTGFVFESYETAALIEVLDRARQLLMQPSDYRAVQRRGMAEDFSWGASADAYARVYREVLRRPRSA